MKSSEKYINRDISWLSFNERVLMEAEDASLPLYERIKFLAIYSSNLEEFYRVRVASIQSVGKIKKKERKALGLRAIKKLLAEINEIVFNQLEEFGQIFTQQIIPELAKHGVFLLEDVPSDAEQRDFIERYFREEVLPFVGPMVLMRNKIAHFLRDRSLYMAVKMYPKQKISLTDEVDGKTESVAEEKKRKAVYAIVRIPTDRFPRFISLPSKEENRHDIIWLDDVIKHYLHLIFPGFDIVESGSVKLSRDADLQIEDEFSGNLVEKIRKSLSVRKIGAPSRFLFDKSMDRSMLKYLRQTLSLEKDAVVEGGRHHNFNDFFGFPNPIGASLENDPLPPLDHPELAINDLFSNIREKDYVLHFPYQKYDYFLQFLQQAAVDPEVTEIHTTQYRVASNSAIVNSLITAAQNGKNVSVFVEIKARFDEDANLRSAAAMEAAGVQVIYSMPGLKVHAKVALVYRNESGGSKGYAFLSTGNFNEKTARIYADHGLLTADDRLTGELAHLFKYLEYQGADPTFDHLLVAQFGLREGLYAGIDREIQHAKEGKESHVLVKLNNLEDKGMIDKLYEASQAGVKIDLIIRGICCLRPGVAGLSENIHIIRIVDRFLEHARVIVFHNLGKKDLFMGSADWMGRNLNRRIEVVFPIYDEQLKSEILHVIDLQMQDNVKAVGLDEEMRNIPRHPLHENETKVRSQIEAYRLIKEGKLGELASISN